MAINKELWDKARTYYEGGKHSLGEISKITGIDKSSISKKAKIQQWKSGEHSDYVDAKQKIVEKKSTLPISKINTLDEIAEDLIRHKKLINDNATKLADKIYTMADSIDTATDLKTLVDANDRLAITLKVADRHAPKIELTNTNAQQTNISIEDISKAIADGLPD